MDTSTFLTSLWELPDGTRASVAEHPSPPHWELCVTRGGIVLRRERCATFADLIAASMAAYAALTTP